MNNNTFYIFPKWLLNYDISSDAKILYMYLLNEVNNSDNDYIYITAKDIENELNFTQYKRRNVLIELSKANLIIRTNRGLKTKTFINIPIDE